MPLPIAVKTKIGLAHAKNGTKLLKEFAEKLHCDFESTPENEIQPFDGYLCKDGKRISIVEVKVRVKHTLKDIVRMGGTYLITGEKLDKLIAIGKNEGLAAVLIVQMSCGAKLCWKLSDNNGNKLFEWTVQETRTKATSIEETTIIRPNAYLPLNKGYCWGT